MKRTLHGGIIIDYAPRGYTACNVDDVIALRGGRKDATKAGLIHPLGQILAHDFLECRAGIKGLYYDNQGETFLIEHPDQELEIVDTSISMHGEIQLEPFGPNK